MLRNEFFEFLQSHYRNLTEEDRSRIAENLISTATVKLPLKIFEQAKKIASHLYQLREDLRYQQHILPRVPEISRPDPGNKSICMSYDFHVDEFDQLKLIEVNTNASFLALGHHMYEFFNKRRPSHFDLDEHVDNIIEENTLAGFGGPPESICITDKDPKSQRLFIEFLVYQQVYQKLGFKCQILDVNDLSKIDNRSFIYNRHTDFYLESDDSKILRDLVREKTVCVSPHPHEYALLADKERLIDWSMALNDSSFQWAQHLIPIKEHLLSCYLLAKENSDNFWSERKKYFVKPLRAFGSKQSYRGESLSRTTLSGLIDGGFIAQEFCPAPEQNFIFNDKSLPLKYDLRFFAYKDKIQLAVARIYQGQVTNLKTPQGGFACVEFF